MFNQKILAEQGEVFKAPNGQIQKISNNAPSHDDDKRVNKFGINRVNKGDGGVEIDADSVLSDSYRQVENGNRENNVKEQIVKIKPIEGESIAGQLGLDIRLKKAISPSQLFLTIQKAKDKKTLSILGKSKNTTDTREGSNSNAVNASQLSTLPTDEEIYNAVFEHTEEKKEQSGIDFEEKAQYGRDSEITERDKTPFDVSNVKSSGKKTALEQANWLSNWYGTRDVVTEPIKVDNELYNYESYPNTESRPQKVKEEIKAIKDTYGFEPAAYNNGSRTVFLDKVGKTTIPLHEFTHRIDGEYGSLETRNTPNIIKRGYQELFGNDLKTDYRELGIKPLKEDAYVTNPQEAYARLNELRYTSGYEPNYKPTVENIQTLRKKNKKNKLFDYYDDNSILQMWNGLSNNSNNSVILENPILEQAAKYGIRKQYGGKINYNTPRALRSLKSDTNNMYLNGGSQSLSDFGIYPTKPLSVEVGKHEQSFSPIVENPNNWIMKPKIEQIERGLDDSVQFLDNWYNKRNRVTHPIQFDDETFYTDIQDVFSGDVENAGAYYDSEFKKSNFRTDVPFKSNTGIHEYTHSIDDRFGENMNNNSPQLKTDYRKLGITPNTKTLYQNQQLKNQYETNKAVGFKDNYYTSPEESYARLNELRRTANFSPNYEVKKEDIQKLRAENKSNQLFSFFDDESILKMWNKLSNVKSDFPTVNTPNLEAKAQYGKKSILSELNLL